MNDSPFDMTKKRGHFTETKMKKKSHLLSQSIKKGHLLRILIWENDFFFFFKKKSICRKWLLFYTFDLINDPFFFFFFFIFLQNNHFFFFQFIDFNHRFVRLCCVFLANIHLKLINSVFFVKVF